MLWHGTATLLSSPAGGRWDWPAELGDGVSQVPLRTEPRGSSGQPWAGTSGDDDVGQPHGGLDVLVEGGLDKLVVLLDDTLDVTATLADVPAQATHQADVRVRVHKYLQIKELK